MAARAQRAGTAHGGVLQIREGVLLGGHTLEEAHVEILLPSDKRAVRPAEGRVYGAVRQKKGDGGKLLFLLEVEAAYIAAQAKIGKAPGLRRFFEQLAVRRHTHALLLLAGHGEQLRGVRERNGLLAHAADDPAEMDIGQAAENQVVRRGKGSGGKRQIAAPVQIIKHVCQAKFPLLRLSGVDRKSVV